MAYSHETDGTKSSGVEIEPQTPSRKKAEFMVGKLADLLDGMGAFEQPTLYTRSIGTSRLILTTLPLGVVDKKAAIFVNERDRPDVFDENYEVNHSNMFMIDHEAKTFAGRTLSSNSRYAVDEPWSLDSGSMHLQVSHFDRQVTVLGGSALIDMMTDYDLQDDRARLYEFMRPSLSDCARYVQSVEPHDREEGFSFRLG